MPTNVKDEKSKGLSVEQLAAKYREQNKPKAK